MAEQQTVREMYESIKPVTRIWLTAAFAVTMGARFGVVDVTLLVLRPLLIWKKFEIWRLVTTFFFLGMPSFNWLIRMYNLYRYGQGLEMNAFPAGSGMHEGNLADHFWGLTVVALFTLVAGFFLQLPVLGPSLLAGVIYLWSKRNPNTDVTLYFFKMKAIYMPWAMVLLALALGDDPVPDLVGIAAAHLFYFLHDVLPGEAYLPDFIKGVNLVSTPNFIYRLFDLPRTDFSAGAQRAMEARFAAYRPGTAPAGAPRFQGQGHVLGRANPQ